MCGGKSSKSKGDNRNLGVVDKALMGFVALTIGRISGMLRAAIILEGRKYATASVLPGGKGVTSQNSVKAVSR
jgi:hypothetical protein